jgi:hypothetical protein
MPGLDIASQVYPTCVIITCAQFGLVRIAVASIFLRRELDRRIKSGDDDGASQRSAGPCFVRRRVRRSAYPSNPRERSADRRVNKFHACEARRVSCETRSPLGAPPRRFLPTGLLQSQPGPTFRPPDPAGFRLRSSGSNLPAMASPRCRARQHPKAPGDGLRNHPQAPHPLRQSRRL